MRAPVSLAAEARSDAPPSAVFAALADASTWSRWAGRTILRSSFEREGDPAPGGVGAIRRLGSSRLFTREEIVEYEPPRRLVYVLLSGMPVRDYRAEVILTGDPTGGTVIAWRASFRPLIPGTAAPFRMLLGGYVRGFARRLAAYAGGSPR
jgi:uncharacterized protein YndB with AHSA1/START domain